MVNAALALSVVLAFGSAASASELAMTYTGSGSGTLNGVAFSKSDFTITVSANTANRGQTVSGYNCLPHDSAAVTIAGLGTYNIVTPTRTIEENSGNNLSVMAFELNWGYDLIAIESLSPQLPKWDMLESIPTLTGTGELIQWAGGNVNTSAGVLVFNNAFGFSSTFDTGYKAVPEPASLSLLACGTLALLTRKRK